MAKIAFKPVTSQQAVLFPQNIGEKIPENHPVRLVNQVVDLLLKRSANSLKKKAKKFGRSNSIYLIISPSRNSARRLV